MPERASPQAQNAERPSGFPDSHRQPARVTRSGVALGRPQAPARRGVGAARVARRDGMPYTPATHAPVRVIVADGDDTQRARVSAALRRYDIQPVPVGDLAALTHAAADSAAALLDVDVAGAEPQARAALMSLVRGLRVFRPELPVLTVSRTADPHLAASMADLDVDWHFGAGEDPELIAVRVRCVVESLEGAAPPQADHDASLRIDEEQRLVHLWGRSVRLSRLELKLLALLVRDPGRVFTRDEIVEAVWRRVFVSTERTVDVVVSRLRRKLAAGLHIDADAVLRTVARVGYAFEVPRWSADGGRLDG